jgi:muramoyltetrapeptide carboxypeptidase
MGSFRWILLFLSCIGCAEIGGEKSRLPIVDSTAESPPKTQREPSNILKTNRNAEICARIGRLNLIGVSPGSGMYTYLKEEMLSLVRKYGINIHPLALENKNYYQCADTDENRLKAFLEAVDSDHEIIWTVRGGFGSGIIIDELNKIPVPKKKKILVGFSDTTSLHLFVTQKWGWKAIHGSVLMFLCRQNFANRRFDTLLDLLDGKLQSYEIAPLYALNKAAVNKKIIKGKLTGGNLTSIESSIGTCWEIHAKNKIIFVEDINLLPWWMYRSMYHLKESGRLRGASAIVFGRFCNGGSQEALTSYMKKFADLVDIPVFVTNEFGHGNNNQPLIYEADAVIQNKKIIVDAKSLYCPEGRGRYVKS